MAKKGELIVGLDIGTTKVVVAVGEQSPSGELTILGVGQAPNRGLRKGMVVDIEQTVGSVRQAVAEAESVADCHIQSVFAGIAGAHIKAFRSHGMAQIKSGEVRMEDVAEVLKLARAAAIPEDREVLHVIPQEFVVDRQGGIKVPHGISGRRLEAVVQIVTASGTAVQNINKCAERADLKVSGTLLEALASAQSVLTEEERGLGVCLVDIGGGTTDLAVFADGALVHTAVIPLGGDHLTNDIVIGLRTPAQDAERLKRDHGCALAEMCGPDETIDVPSVGDRPPRKMARRILGGIIEARVTEILQLVLREIRACGAEEQLTSGLVITGGSSLLTGVEELAEQMLGLIVRRGEPRLDEAALRDPRLATAVGLVQLGTQAEERAFYLGRPGRGVFSRFGRWLRESFT